jgi:hypothetical protein
MITMCWGYHVLGVSVELANKGEPIIILGWHHKNWAKRGYFHELQSHHFNTGPCMWIDEAVEILAKLAGEECKDNYCYHLANLRYQEFSKKVQVQDHRLIHLNAPIPQESRTTGRLTTAAHRCLMV